MVGRQGGSERGRKREHARECGHMNFGVEKVAGKEWGEFEERK